MTLAEESLRDRVAALADDGTLRAFALAYLHRHHQPGADPERVLAEVRGALALMAGRGTEPAAVRAFDPTCEDDGYDAIGSVVETATDDLPFLVDSVTAELEARGLVVRRVMHPIVGTDRDADGHLTHVGDPRDSARRESLMHFELDRRLPADELAAIQDRLLDVLADVRRVVADFPAMSQRIGRMIELARAAAGPHGFDEVNETIAFLRWLNEGTFTFLGYAEDDGEGGVSELGLTGIDVFTPSSGLLTVGKTDRTSPVRRHARMDTVAVTHGHGTCRLIGLFTRKAYTSPAADTPLLGHKLRRILEAESLIEGSHDHRAAVAIFGSFYKDELFAAPWEDLRAMVVVLLAMQADEVRVLSRRASDGRTVSLVVAVPWRRYSPEFGERVERLLRRRYGDGVTIESHLVIDDQFTHARLHYVLHAADRDLPADDDASALEAEVVSLSRSWDDAVEAVLVRSHGALRAHELAKRWAGRFPDFYKAATEPGLAAADVERLEDLAASPEDLVVGLQHGEGRSGPRTRLALYKRGGKVELSEILPILEMLGLQVHDERPARLLTDDGETFVQNLGVRGPDGQPLDLEALGDRLAETIVAVRRGDTDADWLSKLVVVAGLTWRQVAVLRAYRVYRQRAGARFGLRYDGEAFAAQPDIAAKLVRLFERRHRDGEAAEDLHAEILADLDAVESLDQDRILRDQLVLVDATLRTNAFAPGRDALALKLRSADIAGIPAPKPHVEVFVHSVAMEGIHLRGGAIARGGLRWSDRLDFRTEVYGLMRAQMTKNAVIVPTGAKGGFYLKRRPDDMPAAVEREYRRFVSALLEITDDIVEGEVRHPEGVAVFDGDDPYLVVAADKGTATFSDTANALALERGFWLGDAFASGGSHGYDHKALGITARGAWESVRRIFRAQGQDPERDAITVAGVGDMSGDVFGNGLLLSRTLRLVAAYDHRHVFIDPDPDPEASWRERRRLFELGPGTSWEDYSPPAISEGGGVWPRTAKSIPLSPRAREALGVQDEHLTPDEVIRAILRAPVDLLFMGGIGTVVKASSEADAAAHDRASDAIRVDADEIRARVVGEGGNLGWTQRARVEAADRGVGVTADFIDNSAGVDSSDHEVNLKVLLSRAGLPFEERNELLRAATDDVVAHVLQDSYRQARILSREVVASGSRIYAYEDLMAALEEEGIADRAADALPTVGQLGQRRRAGRGLHRPELAVLLAHAKRSLTDALLESELVDDPWFERDLRAYFPPAVVERFGHLIAEHRLRRELVATLVANEVVDALGPSFVSRLATELGAPAWRVVRAYRIARDVTGAVGRFATIDALDSELDGDAVTELLEGVERLVETVTRWYLQHAPEGSLRELVEAGHEGFDAIEDALEAAPPERTGPVVERLQGAGVPETLAQSHALAADLAFAPDVIAVARECDRELEEVGMAFALLGDRLRFGWLEAELDSLTASQRVQRWAVQALRDDARDARRDLVAAALREGSDGEPAEAVDGFLERHAARADHLSAVMRSLSVDGAELAGLMVIVRELRSLAGA